MMSDISFTSPFIIASSGFEFLELKQLNKIFYLKTICKRWEKFVCWVLSDNYHLFRIRQIPSMKLHFSTRFAFHLIRLLFAGVSFHCVVLCSVASLSKQGILSVFHRTASFHEKTPSHAVCLSKYFFHQTLFRRSNACLDTLEVLMKEFFSGRRNIK